MGTDNYAYFQISTKAIIWKEGKILTLTTPTGHIDFPGGRMDKHETDIEFEEILNREILEELGKNIKISIHKLAYVSRRKYLDDNEIKNVALIYYEGGYVSGEIKMSDEHEKLEWLSPEELLKREEEFISKHDFADIKKYIIF